MASAADYQPLHGDSDTGRSRDAPAGGGGQLQSEAASHPSASPAHRAVEVHRVRVQEQQADDGASMRALSSPLVRRGSHSLNGDADSSAISEHSDKPVGSGFVSLLGRGWTLFRSDRAAVYVACLGLLLSWVGNNVLWIYASMYMGVTYAFWLNQACTALYVCALVPVVAWRIWGPRGAKAGAGTITQAMRAMVSWRTYAALGALDALYNLFTGLTSPRTSPPLQNLLFQLPVPAAMLMTKIVWRSTRYKLGQYIGATVIVAGAVVSILPSLIHPSAADSGASDPSDPGATPAPTNDLASVLIYTMGVLFYTAMSVYKAHIVKAAPSLDFYFLSMCESVWCVVWGFAFVPMLWIPHVGTDVPANTWQHFAAGARCMFGGRGTAVSDGGDPSAQCARSVWAWALGWVGSNVAVSVLGLAVCQRGDAVLFNVVNSVQLPLSNLVFSSAAIMTAALAAPFDRTVWAGLALVCVGFAIYQFLPLERKKGKNSVELRQTNGEAAGAAVAGDGEADGAAAAAVATSASSLSVDSDADDDDAYADAPHAQPLHAHDPLILPQHQHDHGHEHVSASVRGSSRGR